MSSRGEIASAVHTPVLLHEALDALQIAQDDVVVDATLGGAGHARAIAARLNAEGLFVGFDLDAEAIERAKVALADSSATTTLIEANFRDMERELASRGITRIKKALFDLGWSSYQLDSGRGFSFQKDEPLRMTYSRNASAVTAATVVNEWKEKTIADIIYGFGEERYARRIARAIAQRREKKPFSTSLELAELIKSIVPRAYAHGRIHPATRTFQALRIAVNDELGAIEQGIRSAFKLLAQGGRIAVITFHSLEDRAVKRLFVELEASGQGIRVFKKPVVPSDEEVRRNPRARGAKLRVFEKIPPIHDEETAQD
jgi:16S rRNA (cytosine1402-N4)-methyltransferase